MNAIPGAAVPGIHQAAGLRGFASEFRDLDHYIRVITERIWEGRRIDDIRTYYSDPCIVETPMSVSTAVDDVISGTRATLAMFPDRRLLAEDVIQSGDDRNGFLSSHRIISPMTHLGDGSFGRATGARIHARTIADCVCKDNRIIHEWLVRDQAAIALQIGSTPRALAQQWLAQRGGWNKPVAGPAPAGYVSHVSREPMARTHAEGIAALLRREGDTAALYDDAAQAHEWEVWAAAGKAGRIPDDKILAPGVLDTVNNFIEHPRLVAQRLLTYADIVGRDRVMAATDCGFGTFAGFGAIHPAICFAKLASMAEGAEIASRTLWG
ncbi:MAG: ester cyclase [Rhodoferax sp.]